jgi:dolichyl-phosphate beta-glucosyltransferase
MLTTEQAPVPPAAGEAATPVPFLSLVIPAYNEERRLGPTLNAILAYLANRPYTSEVIVVSDGSTDGTERVARLAFAAAPAGQVIGCRFIGYMPNAGKGRAVRTGVAATLGRYVAFADADLSTPIDEIDRALGYLASATDGGARYRLVIGSRAVAGARVERRQPLYRRLSARLFNVLRDGLVGIRGLQDTQCGLKVFEGDLARAIFARQRIDGFMFDPETIYIAQRLGLPILEMGVRWADSPETKVRISSALRLIPDLLRIRLLHGQLTPADLPAVLAAAGRSVGSA